MVYNIKKTKPLKGRAPADRKTDGHGMAGSYSGAGLDVEFCRGPLKRLACYRAW